MESPAAAPQLPHADYPAAHSMDTDWFAVDADGHVAALHSGEAGAVPLLDKEVLPGLEYDTVLERMTPLLESGETGFQSELLFDLPPESPGELKPYPSVLSWKDILVGTRQSLPEAMFLLRPGMMTGEIRKDADLALSVPQGLLVARGSRPLDYQVYRNLLESGELLRVWTRTSLEESWWSYFLVRPSFLGIFEYDHDRYDNWISGPYERVGVPRRPVRIEALPPDLQEMISRVRFPALRFAEATALQPFEHFPRCASRQNEWLATDEQTRHPTDRRKNPPDYPAAHSMDTEWFAVDADGCVGIFDSDEGGAVPPAARREADYVELLQAMQPELLAGRYRVEIGDLLEKPSSRVEEFEDYGRTGTGLVLLRPEALPRLSIHTGSPVVIRVPEGLLLACQTFLASMSWSWLKGLADEGEILRMWRHPDPWGGEEGEMRSHLSPEPWRLGMFEYRHNDSRWQPGPYDRLGQVPPHPLRVDQLPPAARQQVEGMRFHGARFADSPLFQPLEFVPDCFLYWGIGPDDRWMASDGVTLHCFGGAENPEP